MPGKFITCTIGDIADSHADAIVNAANNQLWMGAGVAGAIKRRGGASIEIEAMSKGPLEVGEAVATTAGALRARYVIHAAVMGQDLQTDDRKIKAATKNALLRAEELHLLSIDFPALGTGVGGFPIDIAANIMIEVARNFLTSSDSVKAIGFVLFDENAFLVFRKYLGGDRIEF